MQMHAPLGCGAALLNSVNIVIKRLTTTKQAEWEKKVTQKTRLTCENVKASICKIFLSSPTAREKSF